MTQPTTFISHSSLDEGWSSIFAEQLRRLGYDVWYDTQQLQGGDSWLKKIQQELVARDTFLIILSPNSWNSHWCQQELALAQASKITIIPILYQQTQVTGFLTLLQMVDMINQPATYAASHVDELLRGKTTAPPAPPMPDSLRRLKYHEEIHKDIRFITPSVATIKAGQFKMGSDPRQDRSAQDDEQPMHMVSTGAYDMALFPVTVAEYALALRLGVVLEPLALGSVNWINQLRIPDNPVVGVTWHNALAYSRWLSGCSGQSWRLPTEAEWEKAARGSDGRSYPWGNVWDPAQANTTASRMGRPTPIKTYSPAGPYGLYDMSGNVWEWTATTPASYPYVADGRDRLDIDEGRVARGGSWDNGPLLARCAFRMMYEAATAATDMGFRICRSHD